MGEGDTIFTSKKIDMINGDLKPNIILFTLPIALSGILQILFNAADVIVVGRYGGETSLSAVGCTGSLVNLMVNLFIGLSAGVGVATAHAYGAKDDEALHNAVHTGMAIAVIAGAVVCAIGLVFSGSMLELMETPDDIIGPASVYLKIYFIGMPASMIYNFGSAILRAYGDTKRPMYYLIIAGVINVILNLLFVICFKLDVAGVALATVISQCVSAVLTVTALMKETGARKLVIKEISLQKSAVKRIVSIGIPAGVQGSLFSISNVIIQTSINSFGSDIVQGNTAGGNIEGFVYASMSAFHNTAMTFIGQNVGARKVERIPKIIFNCLFLVTCTGMLLGGLMFLFSRELIHIYIPDNEFAVSCGVVRMAYLCGVYYLCGMMDVMTGALRGMGYAIIPMLISLVSCCAFRIIWIYTAFAWNRTLDTLFLSYAISWLLALAGQMVYYKIIKKSTFSKYGGKVTVS